MREHHEIRADCAKKLADIGVSGMFKAVLACLLSDVWTTPQVEELIGVAGVEPLRLKRRATSSVALQVRSLADPPVRGEVARR